MKIYVASSWRNEQQPALIKRLRKTFGEANVYDFRNPGPGKSGFKWEDISPKWKDWTAEDYIDALGNPIAEQGYQNDFQAMRAADVCVLLLPAGRSAHLEAGWMKGAGKKLIICTATGEEPELMNKIADHIVDWFDVGFALAAIQNEKKRLLPWHSTSASGYGGKLIWPRANNSEGKDDAGRKP
jgi:nucleoside 2-deoxyribosyltransferase